MLHILTLFLRRRGELSAFRTIATVFSLGLATCLLLASIALAQGWLTYMQKQDFLWQLSELRTPDGHIEQPVQLSSYTDTIDEVPVQEIGLNTDAANLPSELTVLPPEGEVWVTPGLQKLIESDTFVAERYAGLSVKPFFPLAIAPSPHQLLSLRSLPSTAHESNSAIQTVPASSITGAFHTPPDATNQRSTFTATIFLLLGVILIVPILLLVAEVARIGIMQREKRYAALSLIGASKRHISLLVLADALPLSLLGASAGALLFYAVGAPLLAHTSIGGRSFWASDLQLQPLVFIAASAVFIACALAVNWLSLRAVAISPLRITRSTTDTTPPRLRSLTLLTAGLAGLAGVRFFGTDWYETHPSEGGFLLAALLCMVLLGIVLGGAYIVQLIARVARRVVRTGAGTLAAYHLLKVSRASFHSISGIVIALFVGTLLLALLSSVEAMTRHSFTQNTQTGLNSIDLYPLQTSRDAWVELPDNQLAYAEYLGRTLQKDGLAEEFYLQQQLPSTEETPGGAYYESCEVFTKRTRLACNESLPEQTPFIVTLDWSDIATGADLQFTPVSQPEALALSNYTLIVTAASDAAARPQVIKQLQAFASQQLYANETPPRVEYEQVYDYDAELAGAVSSIQATILAPVVVTLLTGGLSIVVSVAASLYARKRTFQRLTTIGAGQRTLFGALLIETILPLVTLTMFVIGMALLTLWLMLGILSAPGSSQLAFALPGATFWLGLCATLIVCAALLLSVLPILSRLLNEERRQA